MSTDQLTVSELQAEIGRTEVAMCLLRGAAPLNGQALRNDFLYESGIDDSVFAGVLKDLGNDSPSYDQAMRGDNHRRGWDESIDEEMQSLLRHGTYKPVSADSLNTTTPAALLLSSQRVPFLCSLTVAAARSMSTAHTFRKCFLKGENFARRLLDKLDSAASLSCGVSQRRSTAIRALDETGQIANFCVIACSNL